MANEIIFDKKILDELIAEVNGELTAMLKSQKSDLEKAVQESSPEEQSEGSKAGIPIESLDDSSSSDSSSPSSDDSSSSSSDSSSSDSSDSSSSDSSSSDSSSGSSDSSDSSGSSSSDSSSADALNPDMAMAMDDQAQDPVLEDEGEVDLKSEYMKLDPESLKAHCEAAKAALMEKMGAEGEKSKEQMVDPLQMDKMMYSEDSKEGEASKAKEDKEKSKEEMMSKKETDDKIGKLETQLKEQGEAFDKLTNLLLKPIRKSVTQENEVEDVPVLSKNEVMEKLRMKARTYLKKSDRELINKFYVGAISLDKIKHLLS